MKDREPILLLLALTMATGCEAQSAVQGDPPVDPKAPIEIWFEEASTARGLDFHHRSGHDDRFLMPESVSAGAALFDADNDGDLDIYLLQGGSLTDPTDRLPGNQLYENQGDGTFTDITPNSGAEDDGYGMGVACGDYDNDGDTDLYVTNAGPNTLLRNEGKGKFQDVTAKAAVGHDGFGAGTGFFDYDRDGDLDLFVVNYIHWSADHEESCNNQLREQDYCGPASYQAPATDVLYRNNGDGTFEDVTEPSGIATATGNGLSVVVGDFTGDGWPDIFVANDATPDHLWVNQHDGTFLDEAQQAGCAVDHERGYPKAGMGTTAGDLDDDGDLDLMICNFAGQTDSLLINEAGTFTDATTAAGLGIISRGFTRFGLGWADFDNDGILDLYQANGRISKERHAYTDDRYAEPNLLFRGLPGVRFQEVRPRGGTADLLAATSRAAAFGDFDNDGGMDILVANRDERPYLLRNVVEGRGEWIQFRLLDEHGRDAEGATVEVRAAERSIYRDSRTAYSYLACSDPRAHVGLGDTKRVDDVVVRWPDGTTERFGAFDPGRIVTLRRGEGDLPDA